MKTLELAGVDHAIGLSLELSIDIYFDLITP